MAHRVIKSNEIFSSKLKDAVVVIVEVWNLDHSRIALNYSTIKALLPYPPLALVMRIPC